MILDVMFIHKQENNDIDLFKQNFQKIISFDKKLCFDGIKFNYVLKKLQKGIRLKVTTQKDKSTKKEADNISVLKNALTNGKHRSDYHIVFIFDGASEYYCNKLSRFISVFERKIRQFIYLNVLDTYGKEWVKETLTYEMQAKIKRNESNKHSPIEMALECFTFQDYINYLFVKRSDKDPYDVIEEAINILKCGDKSSSEIINILGKSEKISLWDQLFNGFGIEITEDEIDNIRKIRNDIMHNKEISNFEFDKYKKILRISIKNLDKGISNAELQNYSNDANIADVLYSLSETMKPMKEMGHNNANNIIPALGEINKMSQKLGEAVKTTELSENAKNLGLMLKKSYSNTISFKTEALNDSITRLQNSVVSFYLNDDKRK
ncbi:MAG: hypothetical protein SPI59_04090 [Finegoldia sp.]|nr:hypothetical protein [Finegoldia sp.]